MLFEEHHPPPGGTKPNLWPEGHLSIGPPWKAKIPFVIGIKKRINETAGGAVDVHRDGDTSSFLVAIKPIVDLFEIVIPRR